jgi:hypothetical protein
MDALDPDFEYPHHREVLDLIKPRLINWSKTDEDKFDCRLSLSELRDIVEDLENQVNYYESNRSTISLPDLSHLVQIALEIDTYLLLYHYKLMRQQILQKRMSFSEIVSDLIRNYEKKWNL